MDRDDENTFVCLVHKDGPDPLLRVSVYNSDLACVCNNETYNGVLTLVERKADA